MKNRLLSCSCSAIKDNLTKVESIQNRYPSRVMSSCFTDSLPDFCRFACRECPHESIQESTRRCSYCLAKDVFFSVIHQRALVPERLCAPMLLHLLAESLEENNGDNAAGNTDKVRANYVLVVGAVLYRIRPDYIYLGLPDTSRVLSMIHDNIQGLKQVHQTCGINSCFNSDLAEIETVYERWMLRLTGKILQPPA